MVKVNNKNRKKIKERKVERKISLVKYIFVGINVIIILALSVFIGGYIEELRIESLYNQMKAQNLEFQNLISEKDYINYLLNSKKEGKKNISCNVIEGNFFKSIVHLDDARIKLENYINNAKVKEEDYITLKSYYKNIQISYWLLGKKIKESCNSNFVNILYFYGDKKDCPACEDEGVHLSYLKKKYKDKILVYSLDSKMGGPIDLLKITYDVNSRELPVLVIEDEILGFKTNQELEKLICKNYINCSN